MLATMGRNGMSSLWILGNPYNAGGLLPLGLSKLYNLVGSSSFFSNFFKAL